MNDRVIFSDFISSFTNAQKGDKQQIEKLMTTLFEVIEKHLLTEKVVKVRHIGTFKLEWFELRKITNVNTGEISEIGGYYRLAFSPDKEMAKAVNENYAHLQTVSLTSGLEAVSEKDEEEILNSTAEMTKERESSTSENNFVPLNEIKEELLDAKSIMQEISAMNDSTSSTSESSDMDLLAQLYESEAKNTFSERYARLASMLKEETDSAKTTPKETKQEEVVEETVLIEEIIQQEIVADDTQKEEIIEKIIIKETIIERIAINETVENTAPIATQSTIKVTPEPVIEKVVIDEPIVKTPVDRLEAVLAEADKFRDSIFETKVPIKEEIKPVIEPIIEVSAPLIEEIIPEQIPLKETPIEPIRPTIVQPEVATDTQVIQNSTTEDIEKNDLENKKKPSSPTLSKWTITGMVTTILLITLAFGYIYSGYFNKGNKENKNLFSKAYQSIIKLFEPKSIEIEMNDMILSNKDSIKTDISKEVLQKETQTKPTEKTPQKVIDNASASTVEVKTVKVDFAQTLSSISKREYGSRFFWCYIYEANKSKIKDINNLRSGIELIIPAPKAMGIDPNDEASLSRAKEKCRAIEAELRSLGN